MAGFSGALMNNVIILAVEVVYTAGESVVSEEAFVNKLLILR